MGNKIKDQFGLDVEPGKIYGMGDKRSALIAYEIGFDEERGEELFRRHRSSDSWQLLYGQDAERPRYCIELNPDHTEKIADDAELSFEQRVDACQSRIGLLRNELHLMESQLCAMVGVSVGDGSSLSDTVMRMVWDGDDSSARRLVQAYHSNGAASAA